MSSGFPSSSPPEFGTEPPLEGGRKKQNQKPNQMTAHGLAATVALPGLLGTGVTFWVPPHDTFGCCPSPFGTSGTHCRLFWGGPGSLRAARGGSNKGVGSDGGVMMRGGLCQARRAGGSRAPSRPPPSIASLSPFMVWCEHLGPPAPRFSGGVGVRGGHSPPPRPKIGGGGGGDDTASARRIGARCESRPFWAGAAANSSFFVVFSPFFFVFLFFFLFFLFFFSPLQLTKLHQLAMQQSHFPMSHGNTGFSAGLDASAQTTSHELTIPNDVSDPWGHKGVAGGGPNPPLFGHPMKAGWGDPPQTLQKRLVAPPRVMAAPLWHLLLLPAGFRADFAHFSAILNIPGGG
uniref:Uncharacterized protein n=1 Tax=Anas platyrhynchos platyrhynchos TaxID=8840 RepID=A0A493TI41_ANAPP